MEIRIMPIKYSLISGDKAAITFPATAAGTYTIASLDAGLYEITTDTSQASFTLGFEDTNGYRFTGIIRGGKGYVSIGSAVTKIVIPASMTYPVNINIRLASYSLIAAPTSASSAFGSSAYTINYTFTSPSGATDILAYYTDGTNASFGTTTSPKNAVTAVPAVVSNGQSRTALLVAKDANGVSGLATSVITTSNTSSAPMTGGTITTYSSGGINYMVSTFTASGTLIVNTTSTLDYFVVAGGGPGGQNLGGGGGGGGSTSGTKTSLAVGSYAVVVGAGGGTSGTNTTYGSNGNTSSVAFSPAVSVYGGGGGGQYGGVDNSKTNGQNGGCGGGGGMGYGASAPLMNGGTASAGFAGGNGQTYGGQNGGGGGGGGGAAVGTACVTGSEGGNASGRAGAGGNGVTNSLRIGSAVYYAGGGGGYSGNATYGLGAAGLGGATAGSASTSTNGTANTGGGSGGMGSASLNQSNGGSGIVIFRTVV
jgi:hypothetical protein